MLSRPASAPYLVLQLGRAHPLLLHWVTGSSASRREGFSPRNYLRPCLSAPTSLHSPRTGTACFISTLLLLVLAHPGCSGNGVRVTTWSIHWEQWCWFLWVSQQKCFVLFCPMGPERKPRQAQLKSRVPCLPPHSPFPVRLDLIGLTPGKRSTSPKLSTFLENC